MTILNCFDDSLSRSSEEMHISFKSMIMETKEALENELAQAGQAYLLQALQDIDNQVEDHIGLSKPRKLAFIQQLQSLNLTSTCQKFEAGMKSKVEPSGNIILPVPCSDAAIPYKCLEDPSGLSNEAMLWKEHALELLSKGKVHLSL